MEQDIINLKREIRDLKTAQTKPSIMKFHSKDFTVPQNITKGFHYWTIHYEASENPTNPITNDSYFMLVFEFYDPITNTQRIVIDVPYDGTYGGDTYSVFSTRPIASITMDS